MREEYRHFLTTLSPDSRPSLVEVYHAVRNIPYGAAGQRNPVEVVRRNVGSCSGKHILLRDLLRGLGFKAEAMTIFTDFSQAIPDHQGLPGELRRMSREETVPDFHHYLRVRRDGAWLALDATWHDKLGPYGFPVNTGWAGEGDTRLAARPLREYPPTDDVVALKERLLAGLSEEERALRTRFFSLLSEWIATL